MKRAIRVVLLLLSLWVLSGGIAEKEAVKQQALEYMKGKYGEEFVVKQRDGEDCVSESGWGYEVWMYPKKKVPEKDYTSDMEIYVKWLGRDGNFHESYDRTRNNYESWKFFKTLINKTLGNKTYFYVGVHKEIDDRIIECSANEIKNEKTNNIYIGLVLYVFQDALSDINKKVFLRKTYSLIKYFQNERCIRELGLEIRIYKSEFSKNISFEPQNLSRNWYLEQLYDNIKIDGKIFRDIKNPEDLEKYISKKEKIKK